MKSFSSLRPTVGAILSTRRCIANCGLSQGLRFEHLLPSHKSTTSFQTNSSHQSSQSFSCVNNAMKPLIESRVQSSISAGSSYRCFHHNDQHGQKNHRPSNQHQQHNYHRSKPTSGPSKADQRASSFQSERSDFISKFKPVSRSIVEKVNVNRVVSIFGEPSLERYQGGAGFVAALKVKNPEGVVTTCIGFDAKKKNARILSLYHAHLVMKAYEDFKSAQQASVGAAAKTTAIGASLGASPPSAPAMAVVPPVMFADAAVRLSGDLPTLPRTAPDSEKQKHMQAFKQMKLPVVGDPIFDRSSLLVKQYEGDDPKGIKTNRLRADMEDCGLLA